MIRQFDAQSVRRIVRSVLATEGRDFVRPYRGMRQRYGVGTSGATVQIGFAAGQIQPGGTGTIRKGEFVGGSLGEITPPDEVAVYNPAPTPIWSGSTVWFMAFAASGAPATLIVVGTNAAQVIKAEIETTTIDDEVDLINVEPVAGFINPAGSFIAKLLGPDPDDVQPGDEVLAHWSPTQSRWLVSKPRTVKQVEVDVITDIIDEPQFARVTANISKLTVQKEVVQFPKIILNTNACPQP